MLGLRCRIAGLTSAKCVAACVPGFNHWVQGYICVPPDIQSACLEFKGSGLDSCPVGLAMLPTLLFLAACQVPLKMSFRGLFAHQLYPVLFSCVFITVASELDQRLCSASWEGRNFQHIRRREGAVCRFVGFCFLALFPYCCFVLSFAFGDF